MEPVKHKTRFDMEPVEGMDLEPQFDVKRTCATDLEQNLT